MGHGRYIGCKWWRSDGLMTFGEADIKGGKALTVKN
jgi:hypothetical protein